MTDQAQTPNGAEWRWNHEWMNESPHEAGSLHVVQSLYSSPASALDAHRNPFGEGQDDWDSLLSDGWDVKADAVEQPPDYKPAAKRLNAPHCGSCLMYNAGKCWGYGNKRVKWDYVCDSYSPSKKHEAATTGTTYDEGHPLGQIAARHPNVDLFATEHPEGLRLKMIQVAPEHQRQGYAGAALQDLLSYADQQGKPVALNPGGVEDRPGMSEGGIRNWYKGYGFVPNKGRNKDYTFTEAMIRPADNSQQWQVDAPQNEDWQVSTSADLASNKNKESSNQIDSQRLSASATLEGDGTTSQEGLLLGSSEGTIRDGRKGAPLSGRHRSSDAIRDVRGDMWSLSPSHSGQLRDRPHQTSDLEWGSLLSKSASSSSRLSRSEVSTRTSSSSRTQEGSEGMVRNREWGENEGQSTRYGGRESSHLAAEPDELFIALNVPKPTVDEIFEWAKKQDWPKGTELENPSEYHITLLYSPKGHKEHREAEWWATDNSDGIEIKGLDEFPSQERGELSAFVLRVDTHDDEIKTRMERLLDKAEDEGVEVNRYPGGSKPHITVAYGPKLPKGLKTPDITFSSDEAHCGTPRTSSLVESSLGEVETDWFEEGEEWSVVASGPQDEGHGANDGEQHSSGTNHKLNKAHESESDDEKLAHDSRLADYNVQVPVVTPNQGVGLATPHQVGDLLSLQNVAHNLHYKFEQSGLDPTSAQQYASRLLQAIGYTNPDQPTIAAAIQAWQTMYPDDSRSLHMLPGVATSSASSLAGDEWLVKVAKWTCPECRTENDECECKHCGHDLHEAVPNVAPASYTAIGARTAGLVPVFRGLHLGTATKDQVRELMANPAAYWQRHPYHTEDLGTHWTHDPKVAQEYALNRKGEWYGEDLDEDLPYQHGLILHAEVPEHVLEKPTDEWAGEEDQEANIYDLPKGTQTHVQGVYDDFEGNNPRSTEWSSLDGSPSITSHKDRHQGNEHETGGWPFMSDVVSNDEGSNRPQPKNGTHPLSKSIAHSSAKEDEIDEVDEQRDNSQPNKQLDERQEQRNSDYDDDSYHKGSDDVSDSHTSILAHTQDSGVEWLSSDDNAIAPNEFQPKLIGHSDFDKHGSIRIASRQIFGGELNSLSHSATEWGAVGGLELGIDGHEGTDWVLDLHRGANLQALVPSELEDQTLVANAHIGNGLVDEGLHDWIGHPSTIADGKRDPRYQEVDDRAIEETTASIAAQTGWDNTLTNQVHAQPRYVDGASSDELHWESVAHEAKPKKVRKTEKPQKCKECKSPATKSLIWAEGMAYVPVCDKHEDKVRKELGEDEVCAVHTIKAGGAAQKSTSRTAATTLYHGTHSGASPQIEKSGLQWQPHEPEYPDEGGAYPSLTDDLTAAKSYAQGSAQHWGTKPVVYKVAVPDPENLRDDEYHNEMNDQGVLKGRGWEYTGDRGIAPQNITRVASQGLNPLSNPLPKSHIQAHARGLTHSPIHSFTRGGSPSDELHRFVTADSWDTRQWPDPMSDLGPRPVTDHAKQCTCKHGDKLHCPVHGLEANGEVDSMAWSLPEGSPVGYPQDQPRQWTQAVSSLASAPSVTTERASASAGPSSTQLSSQTDAKANRQTNESRAKQGANHSSESDEQDSGWIDESHASSIADEWPTHTFTLSPRGVVPHSPIHHHGHEWNNRPSCKALLRPSGLRQSIEISESDNGTEWYSSDSPRRSITLGPIGSHVAAMTAPQQQRFKQGLEADYGPENTPIVHTYPDGWTLRHLPTWNELGREGEMMHHCWSGMGAGEGAEPLEDNQGHMTMSLRDPNNWPHASFNYDPQDGQPYEIGLHGGHMIEADDDHPYMQRINQGLQSMSHFASGPISDGTAPVANPVKVVDVDHPEDDEGPHPNLEDPTGELFDHPVLYHPDSNTLYVGQPGGYHYMMEDRVPLNMGVDYVQHGRLKPGYEYHNPYLDEVQHEPTRIDWMGMKPENFRDLDRAVGAEPDEQYDWTFSKVAQTMYHWAPKGVRQQIGEQGLRAALPEGDEYVDYSNPEAYHGVYMFHNPPAYNHGTGGFYGDDLWAVDTEGLNPQEDPGEWDASMVPHDISPDRIRYLNGQAHKRAWEKYQDEKEARPMWPQTQARVAGTPVQYHGEIDPSEEYEESTNIFDEPMGYEKRWPVVVHNGTVHIGPEQSTHGQIRQALGLQRTHEVGLGSPEGWIGHNPEAEDTDGDVETQHPTGTTYGWYSRNPGQQFTDSMVHYWNTFLKNAPPTEGTGYGHGPRMAYGPSMDELQQIEDSQPQLQQGGVLPVPWEEGLHGKGLYFPEADHLVTWADPRHHADVWYDDEHYPMPGVAHHLDIDPRGLYKDQGAYNRQMENNGEGLDELELQQALERHDPRLTDRDPGYDWSFDRSGRLNDEWERLGGPTVPATMNFTPGPAQSPMQQGPSPYANVRSWQINVGTDEAAHIRDWMMQNFPDTPMRVAPGLGAWEGEGEPSTAIVLYDTPPFRMRQIVQAYGESHPQEDAFAVIPLPESRLVVNPSRGDLTAAALLGDEVDEDWAVPLSTPVGPPGSQVFASPRGEQDPLVSFGSRHSHDRSLSDWAPVSKIAHQLAWQPGEHGKGLVHEGEVHTWGTGGEEDGDPSHPEYATEHLVLPEEEHAYLQSPTWDTAFSIDPHGRVNVYEPRHAEALGQQIESADPRLKLNYNDDYDWNFSTQPTRTEPDSEDEKRKHNVEISNNETEVSTVGA